MLRWRARVAAQTRNGRKIPPTVKQLKPRSPHLIGFHREIKMQKSCFLPSAHETVSCLYSDLPIRHQEFNCSRRAMKNLKYLHNSFIVIVTSQLRIFIIVSFYDASQRSRVSSKSFQKRRNHGSFDASKDEKHSAN